MSKRNKAITITSLMILLLVLIIGISYAYFTALTSGDEGSSIIVRTANMQLLFTDHGELIMEDVLPGDKISKQFEVANIGEADATYNIRWKEIVNELINDELTLTLECNSYNENDELISSCGTLNDLVGYSTHGAIKVAIPIEVGITHKYTIIITFIETGENQDYNQGKSFNGRLLIDTLDLNITTIRGILVDTDNNPLANKTIEVHSEPMTTTTDSNGEFILKGIEYGTHEIIIKDNNTEIARKNIELTTTNNNSSVSDSTSIYWNETQKSVVKLKIETNTNSISKIDLQWQETDPSCFVYDKTSTSITDYFCLSGNTKELPAITDVVIPREVNGITLKTIDSDSFRSKNLTSVIIPDSVTTIGTYAFRKNKLTNIAMSNNITIIQNGIFQDNQLTNVTISDSVTTIGNDAFTENQLTSVIIGNNVETIGQRAFSYNKLKNLTIPNKVTTIETAAFKDNDLINLTIPNNVTEIGGSAFHNNQLTDVVINGNGSFVIKSNVFNNNPMTNLTIGPGVKEIDSSAFSAGTSSTNEMAIENLDLSNATDLEIIGSYAFRNNQITSVTIPDSVTTIGSYAFSYNQLTSVTIPNSVKTIEANAFLKNTISNPNLSLIEIDNVSGAISGSPWGATGVTINYLKTS